MSRTLVGLISSLVVCSWCLSVGAADRNPHWAVLIGINDYSSMTDLQFCANDQLALRDALVAAGFPEDQVFLLHDDAKESRYKPFKNNIEKQLDLVLKLLRKDDILLIAFSGHGSYQDKVTYICPADAELDKPEQTLISVDGLYKRLEKTPASFTLMMIDSCRDIPQLPGKRSARSAAEANKEFADSLRNPPRGIVLLTSCEPGEMAQEDVNLKHGVFMYHVLQGFGGKADDNKDGKLSVLELYDYASRETGKYVARKFNDSQNPQLIGKLSGNYELATLSATRPATIPTAPLGSEKEITSPTTGMKLVLIPAGEFEMGSSAADVAGLVSDFSDFQKEYANDEQPKHRVKISQPFYLGKFEVTKGEFAKFVTDENYQTEAERDGQGGFGYDATAQKFEGRKPKYTWKFTGWTPYDDSHPVINVTWNDAKAFCTWLSRKEGRTYRLPSEAEWEYACRGGTTTRHPAGDDKSSLARIANVLDQSSKRIPGLNQSLPFADFDDGHKFTSPVGSFTANKFGLHDMVGNVWEWCEDVYDSKLYGNRSGTTVDPLVTSGSEYRVLRGGSWNRYPWYTRSAGRLWDTPDVRSGSTGFRVVGSVGVRTK